MERVWLIAKFWMSAEDSAVPVRARLPRGDLRAGTRQKAGAARPSADLKGAKRVLRRIRLTRSIMLRGEHAEEGSIRYVDEELAHDLVLQGSAVQLNLFSSLFARIWFLVVKGGNRHGQN